MSREPILSNDRASEMGPEEVQRLTNFFLDRTIAYDGSAAGGIAMKLADWALLQDRSVRDETIKIIDGYFEYHRTK